MTNSLKLLERLKLLPKSFGNKVVDLTKAGASVILYEQLADARQQGYKDALLAFREIVTDLERVDPTNLRTRIDALIE